VIQRPPSPGRKAIAWPTTSGRPEDVGHAIAFLLAESGRWITGTTLCVDGGATA